MFENKQDTQIFRDSLLSTAKYLQSSKESQECSDSTDEDKAVQMIASTVNSLTCNLYDVNSFMELFENQQNINRRFHAVVFINLLRSQNITCSEANTFYQSVLYDLSFLNWKFYIKLVFECHWDEYFIECARQLQHKTLSFILKKLWEVQCEEELKYYTSNLAYQSIIWKLFVQYCPSLRYTDPQCSFQFDFCIPESATSTEDNNTEEESKTEDSRPGYQSLMLNHFAKQLIKENEDLNVHVLKLMFHLYKTLFLLISATSDEEPCVKKLEEIIPSFIEFFNNEATKTLICQGITQSDACTVGSSYQIMSWDVNIMYLVFLLQNCWKDLTVKSHHPTIKSQSYSVDDYRNKFLSSLKENNLSYKLLVDLNEKCLESSVEIKKKYFVLLTNVIKFHYPYPSRAAEYLLSKSDDWDEYNVLNLLEENVCLLNSYEIYPFLIDAVPKANSAEKCDRLLRVFFIILSQATPEIYNHAVQYILEKYGYNKYFLSSDFDMLLNQVSRNITSLKNEMFILPLFVQSPFAVLHSLIKQVVTQGSDGVEALQVLKIMPAVCLYQSRTEDSPALIEILYTFFQKSLEMQNAKNFYPLVETLMEIQAKEDIMSVDLFLEKCIFPNASTHNSSKLEITLQCLYVAVNALIREHAFEISSETYITLIKHLGKVLGFCIENGRGKLKEIVYNLFELIAKCKKRPDLDSIFYDKKVSAEKNCFTELEEITLLSILGIFSKTHADPPKEVGLLNWAKDVIEKKFEYLWIWCAVTCDFELFAHKISTYDLSYLNLLKMLTPLLQHFTTIEWLHSTKLIMHYLGLLNTKAPSYPWLLPKNDPELYGVVRCLLDCFSLMMTEDPSINIRFSSSCLTNSISTLVDKTTVPPSLLLNIFLDICYLCSHIKSESFYVFSSFLLTIKKQFFAVSEQVQQKDGFTLLKLGLQYVPDSVNINSFKEAIMTM